MNRPSDDTAPGERRGRGSVRRRLILILAVALSPILIISALQAWADTRDSLVSRRNALLETADQTIDRVEQSMAISEQVLNLFAERIAAGDCAAVYAETRDAIPGLSNVAFFAPDGSASCTARGAPGFDITNAEWLDRLAAGEERVRTEAFYGPISRTALFAILLRHDDEAGRFNGAVAFALRIDTYLRLLRERDLPDNVTVTLADSGGSLLGAPPLLSLEDAWLEAVHDSGEPELFVARTADGARFDAVVSPIGPEGTYSVITRPSPGLLSEATLRPARTVGLPLLAFSITLLVAWLAIDNLVIGWLRRLRQLASAYGEGLFDFRADAVFNDAPDEVAALAGTMHKMARQIGERDLRLTEAVRVRDEAVKEIHHRVKNNLQIVTSFLNLQSRQVRDGEARAVLAAARHRIDALAIVHSTLYQHERLDTVSIRPFLDTLIHHLGEALGAADAGVFIDNRLIDADLPADAAIPIALFMVEALTNSMKYAFDADGGEICVRLERKGDRLVLSVEDDGRGPPEDAPDDPAATGLGSRLMDAFARQLGAELETGPRAEGGYRVCLDMPAPETVVDAEAG